MNIWESLWLAPRTGRHHRAWEIMTNTILFEPLALPNGSTLPNRSCKAAMEEDMADRGCIGSA